MQAANTRRPSAPTSSQPPNGSTSLPRPAMNTNMENHNINTQLSTAASTQTTNPDGIHPYKTRAPFHGTSTSAMPTGLFSTDSVTTRSASGPPLSRLNSNQMAAAVATRAHNASFKDLVAKFNHSMEDGAVRARYARSPSATALPSGYRPHSGPRSPRSPRMRPSANRQASRASVQSTHSDRSEGDKFDVTMNGHTTTPAIAIPAPASPAASDQEESPSQTAITPLLGELSWGMSQWGRPGFGGYSTPPHMNRRGSDNYAHAFLAPVSQAPRGPMPRLATSSGLETVKTERLMSLEAPVMQRSVSDLSGLQTMREPLHEHNPRGNGRHTNLDLPSPTSPRSKIPIRSSSHNPLDASPRSAKRSRHDASDAFAQARASRQQRRSITPPGRFYSTRYDSSPTRPRVSSHRLKAIITAPEPKVSPPLRSSRPRQDIGSSRSNSPIASRASDQPTESGSGSSGTARDDGENAVKPSHPVSEKGNLLTQLSNAVYQRPAPKLTLDLHGIHKSVGAGPLTGATEFEEDISPIIEMPGSFPATENAAVNSSKQNSLQTSPGTISSLEHKRGSGGPETQPGQTESDPAAQKETTQNVLDRIMELRERSSALLSGVLGPPSAKSTSPTSSQKDEAGNMDIMLKDNQASDRQNPSWQNANHSRRGSSAASSLAPASMRGGSGALSPTKRSPTKGGLGRTASRITLDSDSYSVINRVLDQYHETGTVSPEMVHTFQKHIMETDPELSARGDIDSLSIAKAALEDFVRDHSHSNLISDRSQSSLLPSSSQSDFFARDGPRETFQPPQKTESYLRNPILPPKAPDIQPGNRQPYRQDSDGSLAADTLNRQNHNTSAALRLRHQSNADQLVPRSVQPDEARKDREDDVGPTPPPKDFKYPTPPKPDRGPVPERLHSMERQPRQAPTALDLKRPLLPEIPSTGGGLGLLITPRQSYEAPPAQRPSLMQAPPSSYNAVRLASPSPSLRARISSATASSPTSDSARASFGQQNSEPSRSQQDTPASSTQKSASFDSDEVRNLTTSTSVAEPVPQAVVPQTTEQRRLTKRRHTIKELVDTEFSFHQDMKVIEDIYKGTASAVDALTADDRRVLFGNSAQIVEFSEAFLDTLKQASLGVYVMPRNNKWRVKRGSLSNPTGEQDEQLKPVKTDSTDDERDRKTFIGDAFGQHMTRMEKVYGDYLRNHELANQRLGKLQTVPQVNLWLNECHTYASDITSAWDLDSLLVKPVQRILKYPLLLKSLLEETPADHPDYAALEVAVKQMMDVSFRINESKKRAELLDQVVNKPNKRKDYDVSTALSKAFGRRTDKLKQQVGLSDAVEDPEYKAISEKFGGQFFQLQVVMRDMEMYMKNTEDFIKQYNRYIEATEVMIDVGHNGHPEMEAKWKRFALAIREMTALAYADHESAVRKHCIQPMSTLLNMHEAPQRLMQKRKKRIVEYARYLTLKNRGEKLDKRTQEQGEQFVALNETLKDELPKLFMLTAKLVQACLRNYIDIQAQWHATWQRKIKAVLKDQQIPRDLTDIVEAFHADFEERQAQVLSLRICNGSTLAQTATFLTSSATTIVASEDNASSMKRPSILTTHSVLTVPGTDSQSPVLPQPDFVGKRRSNGSSSFANMPSFNSPRASEEHNRLSQSSSHLQGPSAATASPQRRVRAGSANSLSATGRQTPVATPPIPQRISSSQTIAYGPYNSTIRGGTRGPDSRPPTATRNHSSVTLSRLSASSAKSTAPPTSAAALARTSSSTLYSAAPSSYQRSGPSSPNLSTNRFSGVFNSALPASDSPPPPPLQQAMTGGGSSQGRGRAVLGDVVVGGQREYRVLFLAASLFEFNIDRSRKEAGYPYLTYVPGEVFDVIGEKGELWLARNQDDGSGLVGWIWEKHFAKLMPEAA